MCVCSFLKYLYIFFCCAIQQVDEIYTKALHPHGTLNRKNNHRSKPNLNKQQQQQLSSIADTGNVNWVHDKINNNIGIKSKTNHSQHQIGRNKRNNLFQYLPKHIYFPFYAFVV